MPWGEPTGTRRFLDAFRALVRAAARSLPALARGGIRCVHVDADAIAFLRETNDERLLVLASRIPHRRRTRGRSPSSRPLYDAPQFHDLEGGEYHG